MGLSKSLMCNDIANNINCSETTINMPQLADEAFSDGTPTLLSRIRNMWEFANLCQWIYIFGKAVQIDESIDIEVMAPQMSSCQPDAALLLTISLMSFRYLKWNV